jgi:hypothetical protein
MSTPTVNDESPIRVRIPADLDTPDQLVAGLTARQLALLTAVAVPLYGLWQTLTGRVPLPVLAAITAPVAAIAAAVALGRRDGLGLDQWLTAAARHRLRPRRLAPTPARGVPAPASWAPPDTGTAPGARPGVLRLPGEAISDDGVISTGPSTATALVAAATVTAGLHTPSEQAVLLGGYARWLHSLSGPVQIVVSARRVDLGARALHLAQTAHQLAHPALAAAAIEHAEYLLDLTEDGDRLRRTITIACTATGPTTPPRPTGPSTMTGLIRRAARHDDHRPAAGPSRSGAGAEALRRAERTAAALRALGSRCQVLNGGQVTALLAAATDPYGPGEASWERTPPGTPVTAAGHLTPGASPTDWDSDSTWDDGPVWDDDLDEAADLRRPR